MELIIFFVLCFKQHIFEVTVTGNVHTNINSLIDVKSKIKKQIKQLNETKFNTQELTFLEQCFLEHLSYFQTYPNDY